MSVFKKENRGVEVESGSTLADVYPIISDHRATGAGHYVITRTYPSNDVEICALRLSSDDSICKGGGAKRVNEFKSEMNSVVLIKSQSRAKTAIRRKCMTMQANRLLTLTFRENLTDIPLAWKKFHQFVKLMRFQTPDFTYVCVPEYQQRGAVHFHLAVHGYFNYNVVRHYWRRAASSSGGNVDFTSIRSKNGSVVRNPKKIGCYIAKYISKNDVVEFNKRRYSSGGDIKIPLAVTGWLCITDAVVYHLCQLLGKLTHKNISNIWESEDGRFPIICIST